MQLNSQVHGVTVNLYWITLFLLINQGYVKFILK